MGKNNPRGEKKMMVSRTRRQRRDEGKKTGINRLLITALSKNMVEWELEDRLREKKIVPWELEDSLEMKKKRYQKIRTQPGVKKS